MFHLIGPTLKPNATRHRVPKSVGIKRDFGSWISTIYFINLIPAIQACDRRID